MARVPGAFAAQAVAPFARFSGTGILRVLGGMTEFFVRTRMSGFPARTNMVLAMPEGAPTALRDTTVDALYFADRWDTSSGSSQVRRRHVFVRFLLPVSRRLRERKRYQGDMSDMLTKAVTDVKLDIVPVTPSGLRKGTKRDAPTTLSIDPTLYKRLVRAATARGVSRNALINAVLARFLGVRLRQGKDQRLNLGVPPVVMASATFAAVSGLIVRTVWSYEVGHWIAGLVAIVVATIELNSAEQPRRCGKPVGASA